LTPWDVYGEFPREKVHLCMASAGPYAVASRQVRSTGVKMGIRMDDLLSSVTSHTGVELLAQTAAYRMNRCAFSEKARKNAMFDHALEF
jgi:hypothetical protein